MKKKGRLAMLGENLILLRSMVTPAFKLISNEELWSGKQKYEFVIIEKQ
jgi:hypothetical protein